MPKAGKGRGKAPPPPESSEDDDEGEEEEEDPQELVGYLEDPPSEVERRLLTRHFFPSKVGGKPAWLVPKELPDATQDLCCEKCGSRLRFLLQVYASQGSVKESAFHRAMHVFVCTNCQPNEVRVFRAQLPRECPFYPPTKPDYKAARRAPLPPDTELEALCCPSCGLPAPEVPALCADCARRTRSGDSPNLFTEIEVSVADAEELDEDEEDAGDPAEGGEEVGEVDPSFVKDETLAQKIREYRERIAQDPEAALDRSEQEVYEEWCREHSVKDTDFDRFQKFSALNEKHVLRYQEGGKPLWFCRPKKLEKDPPPCKSCGGPRHFEFQVQPQLIALLQGAGSFLAARLDYGTMCIYSCAASCDSEKSYIEEWAYVQPEPTEEWIPR